MGTVPPEIILASASRARAGMLRRAGVQFKALPAHIDEGSLIVQLQKEQRNAAQIAETLARHKALYISRQHKNALVIGSDQVLALEDKIFSKAQNREDARFKLLQLRGREHRLISAVCIVQNGQDLWNFSDEAVLKMRLFDEDFLELYLDKAGDALTHCVGAYEIEGAGAALFETVQGDMNTIMGMPLQPLLNYLQDQHRIKP